jgi:hypothetical protein
MSDLRLPHIEMRRVRWFAVAMAVAAIALAGCGEDGGDNARASAQSGEGGEAILIKTRLNVPVGEVLRGSHIGDSAFCPGARFRDEYGGSGVGTVTKTIRCPKGRLTIAFTPVAEGSCTRQSGPWRIVNGSGLYEGLRGHGRMEVEFSRGARGEGRETFTGTVTR